jgi:hypothetical protein
MREWRNLKTLKRSGRGHDSDGSGSIREGECALLCPACPQPGKNLPEGWENAPPNRRLVYYFTSWEGGMFTDEYIIYQDGFMRSFLQ